jgi:hypothetical protein
MLAWVLLAALKRKALGLRAGRSYPQRRGRLVGFLGGLSRVVQAHVRVGRAEGCRGMQRVWEGALPESRGAQRWGEVGIVLVTWTRVGCHRARSEQSSAGQALFLRRRSGCLIVIVLPARSRSHE